tara:strand:- start:42828 stop:43874 length:1047 start_codon:yes stop_codon:yes gene_type:complete
MNFYNKIKKLIFLTEPETAHQLAISSLKLGAHTLSQYDNEILQQNVLNLNFKNPIGLAAGFDKNAEVPNEILKSGFGFVEVGTVTPYKQYGNKRPRVFRLESDNAIINRLGFNNDGMKEVHNRLSNIKKIGIIGVNIGANKDSKDRINDYVIGIKKFYDVADYLTINISSPNTPGLRDLQTGENISELLSVIKETRKGLSNIPFLIKISPDLNIKELEKIIKNAIEFNIDGLILTNTTIKRDHLKNNRYTNEEGGLSGKPLLDPSNKILADAFKISEGAIPLIGVGGISTAEDIIKKIKNGASLVQLYTGLVYQGPNLINELKRDLITKMDLEGIKSLRDIIGVNIHH